MTEGGKHLNIPVVGKKKKKKGGITQGVNQTHLVVSSWVWEVEGLRRGGLAATSMTSFSTAAERCSDKIQNHLIQGDRVRLRHRHNSDKALISPRTFTIKAKLSVA